MLDYLYDRTCVLCGNAFKTHVADRQKYCSYTCYKAYCRSEYAKWGMIDPEVRKQVYARDGQQCQYCGTLVSPLFIIEHVVPMRLGGPHESYNLVVACSSCNRRKETTVWVPRNLDTITQEHPEWRTHILLQAVKDMRLL